MQHVTWVAFSQGQTLVGVDSSQVEFNAVNKTGGTKAVTLTIEQMPRHNHQVYAYGWTQGGTDGIKWGAKENVQHTNWSSYVGGSKAHPNLPPYKTLYIWQRSA